MNVPSFHLYSRIAAALSIAFVGALIWDNLGNNSAAFILLAGFFLAHLTIQLAVILAIGAAHGKASKPHDGDAINVATTADHRKAKGSRPIPVPARPARPLASTPSSVAPVDFANPSNPPSSSPAANASPFAALDDDWPPAKSAVVSKAPAAKTPVPAANVAPQCAAIRTDGSQCSHDGRTGSKYCVAHQGYRPVAVTPATTSAAKVAAPTKITGNATVKAHKPAAPAKPKAKVNAPKRVTARKKKAAVKPSVPKQQCQAITASQKQCSNGSRATSKYCGIHRAYQPAATLPAGTGVDTAPRAQGAVDTKPAVRKVFQKRSKKA